MTMFENSLAGAADLTWAFLMGASTLPLWCGIALVACAVSVLGALIGAAFQRWLDRRPEPARTPRPAAPRRLLDATAHLPHLVRVPVPTERPQRWVGQRRRSGPLRTLRALARHPRRVDDAPQVIPTYRSGRAQVRSTDLNNHAQR